MGAGRHAPHDKKAWEGVSYLNTEAAAWIQPKKKRPTQKLNEEDKEFVVSSQLKVFQKLAFV